MNIELDLKITKADQKMEEISFKLANYEKIMKSLVNFKSFNSYSKLIIMKY